MAKVKGGEDIFDNFGTKIKAEKSSGKGKPGRKAKEPTKKICVAVPERLIDDITIASKTIADGNITKYIVRLIEKDIINNMEHYKKINDLKD